MFRRLDRAQGGSVEIFLDGEPLQVAEGISLAAALLLVSPRPFRATVVGAAPRAPYCMMGSCFDCLVEIDGRRNQRACQVRVTAGLRVRRQLAAPQYGSGDEV